MQRREMAWSRAVLMIACCGVSALLVPSPESAEGPEQPPEAATPAAHRFSVHIATHDGTALNHEATADYADHHRVWIRTTNGAGGQLAIPADDIVSIRRDDMVVTIESRNGSTLVQERVPNIGAIDVHNRGWVVGPQPTQTLPDLDTGSPVALWNPDGSISEAGFRTLVGGYPAPSPGAPRVTRRPYQLTRAPYVASVGTDAATAAPPSDGATPRRFTIRAGPEAGFTMTNGAEYEGAARLTVIGRDASGQAVSIPLTSVVSLSRRNGRIRIARRFGASVIEHELHGSVRLSDPTGHGRTFSAEANQVQSQAAGARAIDVWDAQGEIRPAALSYLADSFETSDGMSVNRQARISVNYAPSREPSTVVDPRAFLNQRVVGQGEAVEAVVSTLERSRAGLSPPQRPRGSFLFLGPTGAGKTETARAIHQMLYGSDPSKMLRFDMSEFSEKHNLARLIGSPPGYQDHATGGQLTEAVAADGDRVLLFDEVEKAHPVVLMALLQVLEDGRLTDGGGRTVSFKNTTIVMTSNAGAHLWAQRGRTGIARARLGFHNGATPTEQAPAKLGSSDEDTRRLLADAREFAPELLNRPDSVVVFNALEPEHLTQIAQLRLGDLQNRLAARSVTLRATPAAVAMLARRGYQPAFGARPLNRVIASDLERPIAAGILNGEYPPGTHLNADVENDRIVLTRGGAPAREAGAEQPASVSPNSDAPVSPSANVQADRTRPSQLRLQRLNRAARFRRNGPRLGLRRPRS